MKKLQIKRIHLTSCQKRAVKTIPEVASARITRSSMSQKTQIHHERMRVLHRVFILVWTLSKKTYHAIRMMEFRMALDKL
jgi:hypothetical protein